MATGSSKKAYKTLKTLPKTSQQTLTPDVDDESPSILVSKEAEVKKAVLSLRTGKLLGLNNVPSELFTMEEMQRHQRSRKSPYLKKTTLSCSCFTSVFTTSRLVAMGT
ncbi:hypothetical protein DPMN_060425 [Dreissena polymorpha]|uniref:Uncharacterized protein n=1 Tax=Dreissena polymorpha TaxID=45954 RepID=A0A9D4HG04_DREPO|nr:hypothetical protein DPMN_060425 [Dreissena polymorpha]